MSPNQEQRKDRRVPLVLRVDHPEAASARDLTENLSAGGLFVRTERELEPGLRVPLELSFPGLLQPLRVEVEVVWRRRAAPELPAGVAVKIPPDRVQDRDALARIAGAPAGPATRSGYAILLVEDSQLVGTMYGHALERLRPEDGSVDLAVESARNGVEALERLRRGPAVDLVITDLFMPVMDGLALVRAIREDPALARTPVLAISAGGDDARERAAEAGVDVYLTKPVKIAAILETVRALLRLAGAPGP